MARFTQDNEALARRIVARYPEPKSATIPLCHLSQEQDGWLTEEGMAHVAELVGCTPAEVLGTASFYEMFKLHPVGRYCLNICTNISCRIVGAADLLARAEERLGVRAGGTTADGAVTLEDVECIAACTEAPALQVNYRYVERVDEATLDALIDDLRSGTGRAGDFPPHGTLGLVRQELAPEDLANVTPPEDQTVPPWIERHAAASAEGNA